MTYADTAQRYALTSRIATGGMGEVWRGVDSVLGRDVAIKIPKAEYADDATFRARFVDEARHSAALHHPNVAAIFDFGEAPDEQGHLRPFLVMELIEGQQLSALILPGVAMEPQMAADLIAQVATGVGAAHDADIVHRDLKPSNLLVTADGQVKVTDFGIARAGDGVALTHTGQLIGTPHYLSPEQADGGSATKASDVYSLGVVLFECLTGRRPFAGDTPVATALAHLRQPIPEVPATVPEWLREVVRTSLAKDPAERFPDGAALAAALRGAEPTHVLTLPPRETTETTVPDEPLLPVGRRRWLLPALAAFAVLLLVAALWVGSSGDPDRPGATTTSTPTGTASPSPTPFSLTKSEYVGRRLAGVTADLEALHLIVDPQRITNPGDAEPRTVSDVHPTTRQQLTGLEAGDTVVVEYYGPQPTTGDPSPGKGNGKGKGKKR